jgi:hypothetical protein
LRVLLTESVKPSTAQGAVLLAAPGVETIPDAVANMHVKTVMPEEYGLPYDRDDINTVMKGGGEGHRR